MPPDAGLDPVLGLNEKKRHKTKIPWNLHSRDMWRRQMIDKHKQQRMISNAEEEGSRRMPCLRGSGGGDGV